MGNEWKVSGFDEYPKETREAIQRAWAKENTYHNKLLTERLDPEQLAEYERMERLKEYMRQAPWLPDVI